MTHEATKRKKKKRNRCVCNFVVYFLKIESILKLVIL